MTCKIDYTANGDNVAFPFPFAIPAKSALEVRVNDAVREVGFRINCAGSSDGGMVVFDSAPADGDVISLRYLGAITIGVQDAAAGHLADKLVAGDGVTIETLTQINDVQSLRVSVPDALLKSNNLSDLSDAATACANLGLGILASKDTVLASDVYLTGQVVLGRAASGSGPADALTLSQVLDLIGGAGWGDLLYRGATGWARLPAGTSGQFLKSQGSGANPAWADISSGIGAPSAIRTYSQVGTFTWTKPAGLKAVKVTVVGGGCGVAGSANAGNAGGAAIKLIQASSLTATVSVTVGKSGQNGYPVIAALPSSFGSYCSASGAGTLAGGSGTGGDVNITGGTGSIDYQVGGCSIFGGVGAPGSAGSNGIVIVEEFS